MKIGISTSCFYPLETERSLEAVAQGGVQSTEIFFNANCELRQSFVDILLNIQRQYGTEVVSVHPTMSLAESFMLFSAYDRRLEEGLDSYRRYGEIAAQLGAGYVVMHGGKPNGVLDDEQYCERFLKIARAVEENGATLLQENVAHYRAGNIGFLQNMVRYLGNDANFCLDVKQCIRGGYTPFEAIDAVGKQIRHLHISDHTAEADCLLPLDGDFDFGRLFRKMDALDYHGVYMIEVYRNSYHDFPHIFDSFRKLGLMAKNQK